MSFRLKMTLMAIAVTGLSLVVVCASLLLSEYLESKRSYVHHAASLSDITTGTLVPALEFEDEEAAQDTLNALTADPNVLGVWVYRSNGELFTSVASSSVASSCQFTEANPGHCDHAECLDITRVIQSQNEQWGTLQLKYNMAPFICV